MSLFCVGGVTDDGDKPNWGHIYNTYHAKREVQSLGELAARTTRMGGVLTGKSNGETRAGLVRVQL